MNEVGYIAATLLVISEIIKLRTDIRLSIHDIFTSKSMGNGNINDDDEEVFVDLDRIQEKK
jgi:hypothetical protein